MLAGEGIGVNDRRPHREELPSQSQDRVRSILDNTIGNSIPGTHLPG
jgi:hypothetical protein